MTSPRFFTSIDGFSPVEVLALRLVASQIAAARSGGAASPHVSQARADDPASAPPDRAVPTTEVSMHD